MDQLSALFNFSVSRAYGILRADSLEVLIDNRFSPRQEIK